MFAEVFEPRRLRNWQIPKWYPPGPLPRKGKTAGVSNALGHLLPGIPRTSSPWGEYVETWDMPRRITRKIANQLNAPSKAAVDTYKQRLKKSYENSLKQQKKVLQPLEAEPCANEECAKENKTCACPDPCKCRQNKEIKLNGEVDEGDEESQELTKPTFQPDVPDHCQEEKYVPGDLTEENQRLDSYPQLEKALCEEKPAKIDFAAYKTYISPENETLDNPPTEMPSDEPLTKFQQIIVDREKETIPPEVEITHKLQETTDLIVPNEQVTPTKLDDGVTATSASRTNSSKSKSSKTTMSYCKEHGAYKRHPREAKSYVDTIKNFELARELHKVNLEHEPLPDMVPKEYFVELDQRQVPSIREKAATAIGWKGYKGFGATRCTKLKVFRPKTSPEMRKFEERQDSICSFDKKWRFIRQNKVNPIDLAISWDLTPENAADEPRRAKHIDGTNGSIAPAVFSMVTTPKDPQDNDRNEPASGRNPPAVFASISQPADISKVGEMRRPQTSKSDANLHSDCPKCEHGQIKRAQSAYNVNNCRNNCQQYCKSVYDKKAQTSDHFHKRKDSKPSNVCNKLCCSGKVFNQRLCVACELKSVPFREKPKEEFKQAFKAGVPNSKTSTGSSHSSNSLVKVPKQKVPYAKKNYAIRSLSAPFSLNKVREREDYPEHLRLASVYQQSYKPIHLRRKSLLQSVFQ